MPPAASRCLARGRRLGALLNRKGTAWRKLDDSVRAGVADPASARAFMLAQPSVIKRPVIEWPADAVTVGFAPERWSIPSWGAPSARSPL